MDCKKCGFTLNESDVYCSKCGARADGKKACISCGELVDDNFTFCAFCGARLDGKGKRAKAIDFCKAQRVLSPILLLGTLLILFICSFFVGYKCEFFYKGEFISEKNTTFDFFINPFEVINKVILQSGLDGDYLSNYSFCLKFSIIIAIVFLATNILVSFGALVYAGIKYGRAVKSGKTVSLTKITTLAFSVFLCTSVYVLMLENGTTDLVVEKLSVRLSVGSILGIVFSLILLVAVFALNTIKNKDAFLSVSNIVKIVCCLALFVFTLVLLFNYKYFIEMTSVGGSLSLSSSVVLPFIGGMLLAFFETGTGFSLKTFNTLTISAAMGVVFFSLVLIASVLLISFSLNALLSEKPQKKSILAFNIAITGCTILYFVASLIAKKNLPLISEGTSFCCAISTIPLLILSIISLAISIIFVIVTKQKANSETNVE